MNTEIHVVDLCLAYKTSSTEMKTAPRANLETCQCLLKFLTDLIHSIAQPWRRVTSGILNDVDILVCTLLGIESIDVLTLINPGG